MAGRSTTSVKDRAYTGASDGAMERVEVITGIERRRRWSEEQKRAIVAESFALGAVVSTVARRADVSAGQIYRWQEMRAAVAGFAPLLIAAPDNPTSNGVDGGRFCGGPAIEVEFAGKVVVRIPGSIPAELEHDPFRRKHSLSF
jgi:transposase